ncbi:MAG: hypothetical protein RLZZ230_788 [Candidatus Parcubacteria bacterium]
MAAESILVNGNYRKYSMSENELNQSETTAAETVTAVSKKSPVGKYIAALLIVAVIVLGVLYLLEKEGRSSTKLFTSIIENSAVVVVNGEKITKKELDASVVQFVQMAIAQGVDTTNPDAQAQIHSQALDVLINTELLKQSATEKGISVTDQEVADRLESIKTDIGGEDVLAERMATLGIDEVRLQQDIKDELLIQKLLDTVFAEKSTEVSDEEITAMYADAGGVEAGLPPLEEVREQIVSQIKSSKEQVIVDEYIAELKGTAKIDMKESEEKTPEVQLPEVQVPDVQAPEENGGEIKE